MLVAGRAGFGRLLSLMTLDFVAGAGRGPAVDRGVSAHMSFRMTSERDAVVTGTGEFNGTAAFDRLLS
jgi:hypothetical protein